MSDVDPTDADIAEALRLGEIEGKDFLAHARTIAKLRTIKAKHDARVPELLAANNAEVDRRRAAEAEVARLRVLAKPEWFYDGSEDCSSDACRYSVSEVIDDYDLKPGRHLIEIATATQLPSIWAVVHVFTDDEKDERDSDDQYAIQEFSSADDAQAAIAIDGVNQ